MSEDTLETSLEVSSRIVYELRGKNVDPLTGRADSSQSSRVFKSGWRGPMRHVICVVP